ncbi:MAG: 16S rRNA (uracil(1498)-N(3))-methyltransferase [Bacteroidia bacterium]|nr:MAG: 16S rRNA (uracil(1498)-N(3))-methyltransferase [Bacteroidia bacterium]
MYRFYAPVIHKPHHTLDPTEAKHALNVLRLKKNDSILLLDGKGQQCTAKILNDNTKNTQLLITREHTISRIDKPRLTIAVAPTKSMDRMTNFVEKAVEIGISKIIPIACKHSERKTIKTERLQKVAIAALKQSGNLFLPEITPMTKLKQVLEEEKASRKYIAHCNESPHKKPLKEIFSPEEDTLFLIGPEGDFDQEEINTAIQYGCSEIQISTHTLRTETAAIYLAIAADLLTK